MRGRGRRAAWAAGSGVALALGMVGTNACSTDVEVGRDQLIVAGSGGTNAMGGGTGSGGAEPTTGGSAGAMPCRPSECQGKTYVCGDCLDNDADGKADALDPDCLGPCDNTEDSFFGGIPGQSGGGCRLDCYFDNDSGAGNDGCDWTHACDPLSIAPSYPPSGEAQCAYAASTMLQGRSCTEMQATQSASCQDVCQELTPNGCDCFGCCELPARTGHYVWLGSNQGGSGTCTRATLADPSACRPCTPVTACLNRCERCEVCAGETQTEPNCGQSTPVCDFGLFPCAAGASCPDQYYCISGCCAPVPR